MRFRSIKSIKREFLESRTKQSDEEFIAGCALTMESRSDAIKVRSAIANLGRVDAGYVWSEDRFDRELVHFDFWGSLDSVAVVLELEKCLGIRIGDEQASQIPDPEQTSGLTVAEFVRSVLRIVGESPKEA